MSSEASNSDGLIDPFERTVEYVRRGVEGTLNLCLGQDHSVALRRLLRRGISDKDPQQAIVEALRLKAERHEFNEKREQVVRFMSMTGG